MRPRRQIIKTRPQRPYIIARIIIALIIVVALAVVAWWAGHHHTALGQMPAVSATTVLGQSQATDRVDFVVRTAAVASTLARGQEGRAAARMPQIQPALEHVCS
jgi:hypothetical protein